MNTPSNVCLNLGCGINQLPHSDGWVNVDKEAGCNPDFIMDMEVFPWPWTDNSVDAVLMAHVLEHVGQDTKTYLNIIKELYRICKKDAQIKIVVPHPRHDEFISDPTHVRPITEMGFTLFNKTLNREWIEKKAANTPLGLYLDVDFKVSSIVYDLDEPWKKRLDDKNISLDDLNFAVRSYFNVVKQIIIHLQVIK